MVVENLTLRGIYPDFVLWYETFFGTNGIVVQENQAINQTNQTGLGASHNVVNALAGGASAVPAGLENIVAWIITQLNFKMSQINVTQYFIASGVNISGGGAAVLPAPSGGEAAAVVAVIAPSSLFNASEYLASSTCQLQTSEALGATDGIVGANDSLCCINPNVGANGTQFCQSLASIGKEWSNTVNDLCGNFSAINANCSLNSSVPIVECESSGLWDYAQSVNAAFLYAYLQNNRQGVDQLAKFCSENQTAAFSGLNADTIAPFFNFDFGDLSGASNATIALGGGV